MKKEELLKKLQEGSKIEILVPSYNKTYSFKPLTVAYYTKISKLLMEKSKDLNKEISLIISDLSGGQLTGKNINNVDKIAILLALKNDGNYDKTISTLHRCESCSTKNDILFDLNHINTKYALDVTGSYEVEVTGMNFKIVLDLPTIYDISEYERLSDIQKEKEPDKHMYEIYSSILESNLIYIKELYCDNELVDDFSNISMRDKLSFLNRLNKKIVNIDNIVKYINIKSAPISIDFKCGKCDTINSNVTIKLDNFIIG